MDKTITQTVLPIKLEQSSEKLTSMAGLIVLEELARAKGLWAMVDKELMPPGSGRGYKPSSFIKPLVMLLSAGGRALEHLRELRNEQEVLRELGLEVVPEAGTTGDWLLRHGNNKGVEALARVDHRMMSRYISEQGEELTLDLDATIIEADKRDAKWTYKKVRGYQPMMAYVNEICLHYEFREGNEPASSRAIPFLKACEKKLPRNRLIYLRSDSAYYQSAVINRYSQPGRTFSITADQDAAVKASIAQIPEDKWERYRDQNGVATDREIAETVHCMNGTKEAFRLIVQRWVNPQPSLFESNQYCHHAVASNRSGSTSEVIWKHNGRGESENWHKELKIGYGMEQMPCGDSKANAMYFAIGVLTYNLGVLLKYKVLPGEYNRSKVATLRWKIYRLAGKLVRHGRQWILKVKVDKEKMAMLLEARENCLNLSG